MKILVTGGAGFIGSHIVDALVQKGEKVVVLDDLSTGKKENINKKAEFYKIDICSSAINRIFSKEKIDIVIHLAAQMDIRKSVKAPIFDAQINIMGSLNILENSVRSGVRKVLFASSGGAVYGEGYGNLPAKEGLPVFPISPYGIAKLSIEHYIRYYQKVHKLDYTILRYGNVYGERQDPLGEAGVVSIFIKAMLDGTNPIIYGDGEQLRDYIYVKDVVTANLNAIRKGKNQILNAGTGKGISVNTLYKKIRNIMSFRGKAIYKPARKGEILKNYIDIKRAKKILGWSPKTTLDEGLIKTIAYFKQRY